MRWSRDLLLCFLTLCPAAACSSSHSSNTPPSVVTPAVTLDTVCDVLPTRYCHQDAPCCMKAGFGFNQTGCEGRYRQSLCMQGVAAVAVHNATFHPTSIDACIAAAQSFEDKCSLTAADFASYALQKTPCQQVFEGTVAVGAACVSDAECAPGPAPNATFCDPASGTCQLTTPGAAQGGACANTSQCALGLICDGTQQQCVPDPQPEFFVDPQGCGGSADAGP
jgi:hypothetical protein